MRAFSESLKINPLENFQSLQLLVYLVVYSSVVQHVQGAYFQSLSVLALVQRSPYSLPFKVYSLQ